MNALTEYVRWWFCTTMLTGAFFSARGILNGWSPPTFSDFFATAGLFAAVAALPMLVIVGIVFIICGGLKL